MVMQGYYAGPSNGPAIFPACLGVVPGSVNRQVGMEDEEGWWEARGSGWRGAGGGVAGGVGSWVGVVSGVEEGGEAWCWCWVGMVWGDVEGRVTEY